MDDPTIDGLLTIDRLEATESKQRKQAHRIRFPVDSLLTRHGFSDLLNGMGRQEVL